MDYALLLQVEYIHLFHKFHLDAAGIVNRMALEEAQSDLSLYIPKMDKPTST